LKASQTEYFDKISEDYDRLRGGNRMLKHHIEAIISEITSTIDLKNKSVLDIGIGSGLYSSYLLEKTNSVIGIDVSEKMAKIAKRKGFEVITGDVHGLPFRKESFDAILMVDVLHHVGDPIRVLNECREATKRYLVIVEPNFSNPWVFLFHKVKKYENIFRNKTIQEFLTTSGFKLEKKSYVNFIPTIVPDNVYGCAIKFEKIAKKLFNNFAATAIFFTLR